VIALLDVNVLVSLFDSAHVRHGDAQSWLGANRSAGWATCPLTQNGCVRVLSQPRYPGSLSVPEITRRLGAAIRARDHRFWPDSVSICDPDLFEPDRLLGPGLLTDVYLLGLAVAHGGRFVTFDRALTRSAVRGAAAPSLLVI
jgi:uncharacterized protein